MVTKKSNMSKTKGITVQTKLNSLSKTDMKNVIDALAKYYDLPIENLTAGAILHKMSEVLEVYLKTIQQVLQPEEFHSLHECSAFDEAEKSKLFDLYRRIIIAHREILRSMILNDAKDSLLTVQLIHSEILGVKPMMIDIVKKMQHSWKSYNTDSRHGPTQYFG